MNVNCWRLIGQLFFLFQTKTWLKLRKINSMFLQPYDWKTINSFVMQFKRFNVYGVCFFSMLFKINPAGPLARKSYQMADSFTDLADPKKWTVVADSKEKLSVDQLSKSRFNFSFYVDRPVHVLLSVSFVCFQKKMLALFELLLNFWWSNEPRQM